MTEVFVNPECPFSLKSFDLLAQLKKHSSQDFYSKHEEDFKTYIQQPFQQLYQLTIAQLSGEIIKQLHTDIQENIFLYEPFIEYNLFLKQMETQWNNAHFFIRIIPNWFMVWLVYF
ncbi:hypothetical protein [Nostoc sp. ChiVER01]|uniref:hypothetical protein n=1 Tax=Nostoc sp. ChiVER01 TaxID=3075382 RepID=UPI002AD55E15|nr:hypothetical protein [Nostoc sp. ChiVER01]MDZ8223452.1 hypothetical protein [Nostoc sp. ChiVER01]